MTRVKPWWYRRTGQVNGAIVAALLLFILWATFFR
jgi:hypothetical protein